MLRDGIRLAHHHIAHVSVQSHRNGILWDHGSDERRTPHAGSVKMQAMRWGVGRGFSQSRSTRSHSFYFRRTFAPVLRPPAPPPSSPRPTTGKDEEMGLEDAGGGGGRERGAFRLWFRISMSIAEIADCFRGRQAAGSGSCPAMMHACHRVVISDNTSPTPPRLEDGCHFRPSLS